MWGDPGAAKAPPNNRRAFAQRNPIGRLHAQTHHAANDALTNGKPGKVPARHVPMLAARAPGLQGETIVVVYAGRGIFSSFVGLFFASEMFPIIFIFFLYLSFPSLLKRERRRFKKKRALLLLCAKEDKEEEDKEEEDKEEGRPPGGRLFLSLSFSLSRQRIMGRAHSFVQKWIDRSTRRSRFSFSFSFSFYIKM